MKISIMGLLIFSLVSGITGALASSTVFKVRIDGNTVGGYHCTPITTHTRLESAKAQVRVYQDMARG